MKPAVAGIAEIRCEFLRPECRIRGEAFVER
jgi:hypothetical protein